MAPVGPDVTFSKDYKSSGEQIRRRGVFRFQNFKNKLIQLDDKCSEVDEGRRITSFGFEETHPKSGETLDRRKEG